MVLEARSLKLVSAGPKSGFQQSHTLCGGSKGGGLVSPSFQLLMAASVPWLSPYPCPLCLFSPMAFSSSVCQISLSLSSLQLRWAFIFALGMTLTFSFPYLTSGCPGLVCFQKRASCPHLQKAPGSRWSRERWVSCAEEQTPGASARLMNASQPEGGAARGALRGFWRLKLWDKNIFSMFCDLCVGNYNWGGCGRIHTRKRWWSPTILTCH